MPRKLAQFHTRSRITLLTRARLTFGLRVVGVTHDVWVRPICTKRVRFDHFLARTWARRRRIQKGQKSEPGLLRRSDWRTIVLGHTFLVTKILQAHSSHDFWTVAETIKPCHATRLFQFLFWGKQFSFARRSAKILSRSWSLLICLAPYLEGHGHWSDRWIFSIRS